MPVYSPFASVCLRTGLQDNMNEKLLQASENRFRKVIEANADSVVIVDAVGIIQYVNPAAINLFARQQPNLIGAMFGYPVVANETTEIDIINPDSVIKVAEMRVVEIVWQQEIAYLASLRDITDRKRDEEGLRAREHFLTWLNEITRAALETPDFSAMLQIFAERLGELFGADGCNITLWHEERQTAVSGAISSALAQELFLPDPDVRQKTMTEAVLKSGRAFVLENVGHSPYAATHTAMLFPSQSIMALPLIAGSQKLGAAFIIFLAPHHFTPDEIQQGEQVVSHISLALAKAQALKAEKEQRELAETLSKVIGALGSSLAPKQVLEVILGQLAQVVAYDTASVLLLINNNLENVAFRANGSETAVSPNLTPAHIKRVFSTLEPVIVSAGHELAEAQRPLPPSGACWLGVPLIIKGRAIGLLSLTKSETAYYSPKDAAIGLAFGQHAAVAIVNAQLHEQIQQYADELENRVNHRTQELRQAYVQLQELDRLKSKFIDDISHELRTPLANLMLYIDLLRKSPMEKYAHYLNVLNLQTGRLIELVESILRLSQLDLNQDNDAWTRINLNDVAAHVLDKYQFQARRKGLNLLFTPHTDDLSVRGSFKQLAEVTTILLENAIKYTETGEIRLNTFSDPVSACACLQIEDTGIGVAADDIPHLFDRFYRGRGASQSNMPGMGLGLNIAQSIVALHNGSIEVSSNLGVGTRFRVALPLL